MVRRIASQVHKQAARLLRSDYIKHQPAWYQAVLDHPPLPLPAKAPPPRPEDDVLPASTSTASHLRPRKERPLPIHYLEDEVRRQFFRDHPFEAFRERTLVEGAGVEDEHPIRGEQWHRLRQRGRNPSSEDAVRFTVNLHVAHQVPLTKAYVQAVSQFRALRAEQHIATTVAAMEAEYHGAEFGPSVIERTFAKEEKALETWDKKAELNNAALVASKRWRAVVEREGGERPWTRGEEYVRLWKKGIRPTYAALTEPVFVTGAESTPSAAQMVAASADFMQLKAQ